MKKANLAKKSLAAILMLAMLLTSLAMLPVSATEPVLATAENPILVGSVGDLNALATTVETATPDADGTYYIEFTADIDYEGGTIDAPSLNTYTVHIDGKGYTVKNYDSNHGIFFNVGDNSTIQNLHATGVNISCGSTQVGAILGYAHDGFTMKNCSAEGTIVCTAASSKTRCAVGGLVGAIEKGTTMTTVVIEDCVSNVKLTAPTHANTAVGGIIGRVSAQYANIVLHGCTNNGAINGGYYAGGMIGYVELARELAFEECVNTAKVSTTGIAAGGMLGYGNAVDAETTNKKGQIVASCTERWEFIRALNRGEIAAASYAGGLTGYTYGNLRTYYSNSGNEGTVSATASDAVVGGLHGYAHAPNRLSLSLYFGYSYNIGTLKASGTATTGGAIAYATAKDGNTVEVSGFYDDATRTLSGSSANGRHGLLVGRVDCYTLQDNVATSIKALNLTNTATAVKQSNVTVLHTETEEIAKNSSALLDASNASKLLDMQRSCLRRQPNNGSGTKNDPYQIGTLEELHWFLRQPDSVFDDVVYAELTADIACNGYSLSGDFGNMARKNKGGTNDPRELHFDGKGYTISNYSSDAGLFQRIGEGSVIQNLNVSGATVTNVSASRHAGTIVGSALGSLTMLNCTATNSTVTVELSGSYAGGGLIGGIGGRSLIVNCHNDGVSVSTLNSSAGGIIGRISTTDAVAITDCTSNGTVSSTSCTLGVGGIVGAIQTAGLGINIYNCTNTGTVGSASETAAAGGIVGYAAAAVTVQSSRNEGNVTASAYAGGIVGQATATTTVNTCANVGTITAGTNAGAMLGSSTGTTAITASYNEGTAADGLTAATATTTNCYNGAANRIDAIKSLTDTRIDTTPNGKKLSVRIKVTDDFGLMGITYLGSAVENGAKTISDYDEVGFYFLRSEETVTPAEILAKGVRIEGGAYKGSETRFASAYAGIHPTEFDDDLHFVAYAKKGNVEILSSIRTVDIEAIVTDLSDDGCLGAQEVTTDALEIRLYGSMLRYATAYKLYATREIKIGNLNLMQDHFSRASATYTSASDSHALENINRYAEIMNTLDLDILGMNEVNLYRKNYGGYNVPWEVARRMEIATGEEYYWAFASAVDRAQTPNNSYASATGTEGVDYPDGHYWSGDGGDARSFDKVCYGEGLVSKYPIVKCTYKDIYAEHIGEDWSSLSEMSGQERRIILVVQLDIDGVNDGEGDIITVMIAHLASTYSATAQAAAVAAIDELVTTYGDTPIFLMGDLNLQRINKEIEQIDGILNRAGNDDISPTFRGGYKLDYVYYGKDIEVMSYDAVGERHVASDHFPVYVTARITRKHFD